MGKKKKKAAEQDLAEMPEDIAALQSCLQAEDGEEEVKPKGKKRKQDETAKPSEPVAGNKKKKKKGNEGNVQGGELESPSKTEKEGAGSGGKEVDSDCYRAAGVVFFTRGKTGSIDRALLALEERKVQAAHLGLEKGGKVSQRMIVFPQGRREKKDKSDPVETAKREYIEETGDFGEFSQYLDVADFDSDDDEPSKGSSRKKSNCKNIALWFAPASMVVLFCEIPQEAAQKEDSAKGPSPDLPEVAKDEKRQNTHSYRVGKMNHVECVWVDIVELRKALASESKAPNVRTRKGEEYHMFPMNLSILRIPEAKEFLGVPEKRSK